MLESLMQIKLSFVRMFCGAPSEYLWEDDFGQVGQVHTISQGESGEQGDTLPLLFALRQHGAWETTTRTSVQVTSCSPSLMTSVSSRHPTTLALFTQEALWAHARIDIHLGKTKVWNASGTRPERCTVFERMAEGS